MLLEEEDRAPLKQWVIPKLEKASDADAAVLADYVIALVAADDSEAVVRKNCLDALPDFLHDNTDSFIDEILNAVKTKPWSPSKPITPPAADPPFNPPTGPAALQLPGLGQHGRGDQSRKRRFNDSDTGVPGDGHDPHYRRGQGNERPLKQAARRGARLGRGGFGGQDITTGRPGGLPTQDTAKPMASFPQMAFPGLPTPPGGFPFDAANPMAFFAAMMSMGFPGMSPSAIPGQPQVGANGQQQAKGQNARCKDYDTKGYCALGSACPYEHGGEVVMPPEYDPNDATLVLGPADHPNGQRERRHGQGRNSSRSKGARGGQSRAPFSQAGPSYDLTNTSIVVEQIPEENFSEEDVRNFFSRFGNIIEVSMQAYKRLAIVKYDDHYAAQRAYDSPKVIFDNRFVKVYWLKADSLPRPPKNNGVKVEGSSEDIPEAYKQDEEMLDPEEIEKRQAEAQKAYEERQRKAQESAARLEEIEKKLQAKDEEMKRLRRKLAEQSRDGSSEDTELIDQLASLQAEAQDLGYDPEASTYPPRGRGRGGYRGRGAFPPRARGYNAFRGGYRGRGFSGAPFMGGRSSVKRLDNRPKRVAVSGIKTGSKEDEALRQHLLSTYEFDSIDEHSEKGDTQIITFKERYIAEMFLAGASSIPDIGKVDASWVPNAASSAPAIKTEMAASEQPGPGGTASDTKMVEPEQHDTEETNGHSNGEVNGEVNGGDADYDVADDEDRWMAS